MAEEGEVELMEGGSESGHGADEVADAPDAVDVLVGCRGAGLAMCNI